MTIVPALQSITPIGSSGGALINVQASGLGEQNAEVNLYHEATTTNLCDEVTFTGFGAFTCKTKKVDIAAADVIKLVVGAEQFDCGVADITQCSLTQDLATSPTATAVSIMGGQTIVNGMNFPIAGYTAHVVF